MRRLMSTAKTTMHPAASPERNYMLDASAAIINSRHRRSYSTSSARASRVVMVRPSAFAILNLVVDRLAPLVDRKASRLNDEILG
jgi:hypothetical protein